MPALCVSGRFESAIQGRVRLTSTIFPPTGKPSPDSVTSQHGVLKGTPTAFEPSPAAVKFPAAPIAKENLSPTLIHRIGPPSPEVIEEVTAPGHW